MPRFQTPFMQLPFEKRCEIRESMPDNSQGFQDGVFLNPGKRAAQKAREARIHKARVRKLCQMRGIKI